MNTGKLKNSLRGSYPTIGELAHYDREARRLRAEFVGDAVSSFILALDLLIRRVACRIAARLFGSDCVRAPAR